MRDIVLIAHNLRSNHNVGSLLRTADGIGVSTVYLTGYTPYPAGGSDDDRLPHIAARVHKQISKTALGAEDSQQWRHGNDITGAITKLKTDGYNIVAIEQTDHAIELPEYRPPEKVALIVGREVEGVEKEIIDLCDAAVVIPMFGQKESLNVVQAAAMGLYHCRFIG